MEFETLAQWVFYFHALISNATRQTAASCQLDIVSCKMTAYLLTGSSAILSDGAESVAHAIAVAFAVFSLWPSMRTRFSHFGMGTRESRSFLPDSKAR
jgi:divalent metal cation (Fe/Co/Zn/Cd) transporter